MVIVVYLIGGILINKYVRKTEKADLIPNKNFWKDFPVLAKVRTLLISDLGDKDDRRAN